MHSQENNDQKDYSLIIYILGLSILDMYHNKNFKGAGSVLIV